MTVKDQAKNQMENTLTHLKEELKGLRTGRANPALLEGVTVEVYGTQMRLKDLSSISVPEPRQLLISPFDGNNTPAICKGIEKANLNLQPVAEGNVIRISIPPMNEELRKDMVKECKRMSEQGKVSIRNTRRDANDQIKKDKSSGDIGEDEMKRVEKEIQDLTDKFCKEIDELSKTKEQEILTI